jgi:hypothetical protein
MAATLPAKSIRSPPLIRKFHAGGEAPSFNSGRQCSIYAFERIWFIARGVNAPIDSVAFDAAPVPSPPASMLAQEETEKSLLLVG